MALYSTSLVTVVAFCLSTLAATATDTKYFAAPDSCASRDVLVDSTSLVRSERYAPLRVAIADRRHDHIWVRFEADMDKDSAAAADEVAYAIMIQAVDVDSSKVLGSWADSDSSPLEEFYEIVQCSKPKV